MLAAMAASVRTCMRARSIITLCRFGSRSGDGRGFARDQGQPSMKLYPSTGASSSNTTPRALIVPAKLRGCSEGTDVCARSIDHDVVSLWLSVGQLRQPLPYVNVNVGQTCVEQELRF